MTASPDINRLSLEDRIRKLETRLPAPGVGGTADFLLNPKIVDQCAENAVTQVDTGLIFKFVIENFYELNPRPYTPQTPFPGKVFNNLELRGAFFFPKINGVYCSATGMMHRAYIKNSIGNIPPPHETTKPYIGIADINIDGSVFFSEIASFFPSLPSLNIVNVGQSRFAFFDNPQGTPTATNQAGTRVFMSFGYSIQNKQNSNQFQITYYISGTRYISGNPSKYAFDLVYPSCGFGMDMKTNTAPFSYTGTTGYIGTGGPPSTTGCTTRTPSGLPEKYRFMFPDSWSTS